MPSRFVLASAMLLAGVALAQDVARYWTPKPIALPAYTSPHKPLTRLTDLVAKAKGSPDWSEEVVNDDWLRAQYISSAPGTVVSRRFHPDTRAWWIVMDGKIRFDIEGQTPFVATKGSMVQVPMQTLYTLETIGTSPSLRLEVTIAHATEIFPGNVAAPSLPGFVWLPTRLERKPGIYGPGNAPHINLYEQAKQPGYKGEWFVRDDRGAARVIYGYEKDLPAVKLKDRGHYHPESSEFWLILRGQIKYRIEGQQDVLAEEGDVVYVPPFTFHRPRFFGPGPACRLAMNGFPNITHVFDYVTPD